MFGRVLLVLAAAQSQGPPAVELGSPSDQTSAPDGADGFRVHRVRPPLDKRAQGPPHPLPARPAGRASSSRQRWSGPCCLHPAR